MGFWRSIKYLMAKTRRGDRKAFEFIRKPLKKHTGMRKLSGVKEKVIAALAAILVGYGIVKSIVDENKRVPVAKPGHAFTIRSDEERWAEEGEEYYAYSSGKEKDYWKAMIQNGEITEKDLKTALASFIEAKERLSVLLKSLDQIAWKDVKDLNDARKSVHDFIDLTEKAVARVNKKIIDTREIIVKLENAKKEYDKLLK